MEELDPTIVEETLAEADEEDIPTKKGGMKKYLWKYAVRRRNLEKILPPAILRRGESHCKWKEEIDFRVYCMIELSQEW